jgi:SNF2 family DNA or RNA helicase
MAEDLALHDYQTRVVDQMIQRPHLGLFLDPGLGKTAITLTAFRELYNAVDVSRMLVVAPLRVCYSVWPREIEKWRQFNTLRYEIIHGKNRTVDALNRDAEILIINPEGLEWLVNQVSADEWGVPEMLVVDESTKFKRRSAKRSRYLAKLLPGFARRYALTGTPAPNGLEDLHGQMFIIDMGQSLDPRVSRFRNEYFVSVPCGAGQYLKWKPRRGSAERIYKRISPWVVRLDARDHLELPEKIQVEVLVSLPEEAKAKYEELKRDMILQLEEGEVLAMNAAAITGKCRQIANGAVYLNEFGQMTYDPEGGYRRPNKSAIVHTSKVDALLDLVEELGGKPLLVGFEYRHERDMILAALKKQVGRVRSLDGDTSGTEGQRIERAWNAGDVQVLLAHPLTAAHGLNLQDGGHHLAWFSIPWDLELHDQMVGRVWRQGQKERTFIYYLTADDTIDQTVTRTLKRKARDQGDLLDALRKDIL